MATAATKTIRVKLTYDFAHETLTTTPRKPVFKKGEKVKFYSKEGDVQVLLSPKGAFKPNVFSEGDPPVLVTKGFKNGMIWCGGDYRRPAGIPKIPGIWPAPPLIHIDPNEKLWGSQSTDH